MYLLNKKIKKSKNGFSLVETLVAIFILAMAIAAAMTVANSSLQASFYARDRIAAFFLAQEAIELIKNKRDVNGLSGNRWLGGIANWDSYGGWCGENSACGIDIDGNNLEQCLIQGCELCKTDSGLLLHRGNNASTPCDGLERTGIFRTINMKKINANEAKITVKVSWTRGLGTKELVVSEHILNWHPFSDIEE